MVSGSIFPSFITIFGDPEVIFLMRGDFRFSHETTTSKQTSDRIGVIPTITGIFTSSSGRVAIFDTRIVITSSEGCNSPN